MYLTDCWTSICYTNNNDAIRLKKEHNIPQFPQRGRTNQSRQSRKTFWVIELKEMQYVRLPTSYLPDTPR